jgi:hypothetical protein
VSGKRRVSGFLEAVQDGHEVILITAKRDRALWDRKLRIEHHVLGVGGRRVSGFVVQAIEEPAAIAQPVHERRELLAAIARANHPLLHALDLNDQQVRAPGEAEIRIVRGELGASLVVLADLVELFVGDAAVLARITNGARDLLDVRDDDARVLYGVRSVEHAPRAIAIHPALDDALERPQEGNAGAHE